MNEKKVPEIRFKGFTDDWEQRKVSEITAFHKQGYYTTEEYGDDKKYYLLRGTDLTENRLALNDTPKINATERDYQAFKIQVGDFLIVRSGTVGTYGIVYDDIPAIFGSYLIDFRFDHSKATNEFFGYFYQSDLFKEQLRQIIQQSANTNINAENIKSTWIKLPSIEEQNKIGTFLGALDNLITLHQRKHKKLLSVKKSMLEKMFPQNGAKVPEIRFEGFTDDWEQRKLSELGEIMTGSTPSTTKSEYYSDDGLPWVTPTDIESNIIFDSPRKLSEEGAKVARIVPANTILCTCIASIGKNALLTVTGSFNQQINSLTPNAENDPYFLLTESEFWSNHMKKMAASGTMQIVNKTEFSELLTMVPKHDEQKKIGAYFRDLDNLITLHQRELDKLVNIKKSMLEKMFV